MAQLAITLAVSFGFMLGSGAAAGLAALAGGLINVLANLYFAWRVFACARRTPKQMVRDFYMGEAVKLLMTAALFALAIAVFELAFVPLLTAFVAGLLVFWLALLPGFSGTAAGGS